MHIVSRALNWNISERPETPWNTSEPPPARPPESLRRVDDLIVKEVHQRRRRRSPMVSEALRVWVRKCAALSHATLSGR